jgi:hypothetical protein
MDEFLSMFFYFHNSLLHAALRGLRAGAPSADGINPGLGTIPLVRSTSVGLQSIRDTCT